MSATGRPPWDSAVFELSSANPAYQEQRERPQPGRRRAAIVSKSPDGWEMSFDLMQIRGFERAGRVREPESFDAKHLSACFLRARLLVREISLP